MLTQSARSARLLLLYAHSRRLILLCSIGWDCTQFTQFNSSLSSLSLQTSDGSMTHSAKIAMSKLCTSISRTGHRHSLSMRLLSSRSACISLRTGAVHTQGAYSNCARSPLHTDATTSRFLPQAHRRHADAVTLDAVPPARRPNAPTPYTTSHSLTALFIVLHTLCRIRQWHARTGSRDTRRLDAKWRHTANRSPLPPRLSTVARVSTCCLAPLHSTVCSAARTCRMCLCRPSLTRTAHYQPTQHSIPYLTIPALQHTSALPGLRSLLPVPYGRTQRAVCNRQRRGASVGSTSPSRAV